MIVPRKVCVLGSAGVLAVVLGLVAIQGDYPSDDALIHVRFAQNFCLNNELAFNPGEPSYSTTSPLWNLLVGAIAKCCGVSDQRLLRLSQVVAIAFLILASGALVWLTKELYGRLLFGASLLFVLDPYVTATVHGAMEQCLFVLLGAIAFVLALRAERGRTRHAVLAALVIAFQYLARPEAVGYAAATACYLAFRQRWRQLAGFVVAYTIASGIIYLSLLAYFGTGVPYSLIAKTSDTAGWLPFTDTMSMRRTLELLLQVYAVPLGVLAILFVRAGQDTRRRMVETSGLPVVLVVLLTVVYLGFMKEKTIPSRYFVNYMPFTYVVVAGAMSQVKSGRLRSVGLLAFAVYLIGLNLAAAPLRRQRGLDLEPQRIEIGRWIASNTEPNAAVFVYDIGYIGFYANRRVYDFNLVPFPGAGLSETIARRRGTLDLPRAVTEHGIDYLVWGRASKPDLPLEEVYVALHGAPGNSRAVYRVVRDGRWRRASADSGRRSDIAVFALSR